MADLLADIRPRARWLSRPQNAFARATVALGAGSDRHNFNVNSLIRIYDLNPLIFVCSFLLLDEGIDEPEEIRRHKLFRSLLEKLKVQPNSAARDPIDTRDASLTLLEVFTYMVLIHRARSADEALKEAITTSQQQEFTA